MVAWTLVRVQILVVVVMVEAWVVEGLDDEFVTGSLL